LANDRIEQDRYSFPALLYGSVTGVVPPSTGCHKAQPCGARLSAITPLWILNAQTSNMALALVPIKNSMFSEMKGLDQRLF
jgi:hypothetical protein